MSTVTRIEHPTTFDRPVTVAVKTSGHSCALIPRGFRFPVAWALDTTTGALTVNGATVGHVLEIIPGRLYAYEVPLTHPRATWQTSFTTAAAAAECGAVRHTIEQKTQLWAGTTPIQPSPAPTLKGLHP